LGFWGSGV